MNLNTIKYKIQLKKRRWPKAEGSTTRIGNAINEKKDQKIGLLSRHAIRFNILFRDLSSAKAHNSAAMKIET